MDLFTAKKLTALRKYHSLSQEALAEKAGVSRQAVSKWERGEASPDTDNLLTLSRIYSVSIDDLLGDISAEELIAVLENKKETQNPTEAPKTVDTQGPATEVINEAPQPATGVYTEIPAASPTETAPSEAVTEPGAIPGIPVQPTAVTTPSDIFAPEKKSSEKGKKGKKEKPAPLYPGAAKNMLKFPYIIVAAIVYIIIGYTAKIWHPTWLIFLTIPAYYLTVPALFAPTKKKILMRLPAYYYIIMLYIFLGILFSLWAKTWILFLFIPVYYWVISILKFDDSKK